jgi:16S rRNA (cytosine967-C5)-methyltransferase
VENLIPEDKALLTEIINGVIRWKSRLDWVLVGFYVGDYLKCLSIVKNAMRVALYQILYLDRVPISAAINESVEFVKRIQGIKTAGIVNGVLRNIARNLENIRYPAKEEDPVYHYSVMYSHPRWMVRRWLERFGDIQTETLLEYNNYRPALTIRINLLRSSVGEIHEYFSDIGIELLPSVYLPQSFTVRSPGLDLKNLDVFKQGKITIQDVSASLAVKLTDPKPGSFLVDLCAAPGGKSLFAAELMKNEGTIIAMDKYPVKLLKIDSGAARMGFTCIKTEAADATSDELEFEADYVLADVPCSGLGTLSKKPDIKWKREREDIYKLAELQRKILESAARLVKPGGILTYSTCTMEPEENEENIIWFLSVHPEFHLDPAEKYLPAAVCKDGYMQTFPHIHYTDGAFAARLIKGI